MTTRQKIIIALVSLVIISGCTGMNQKNIADRNIASEEVVTFTLTNNRTGRQFTCSAGGANNSRDVAVEIGMYGNTNCSDHDAQATLIFNGYEDLRANAKTRCTEFATTYKVHLTDAESIMVNEKCYNIGYNPGRDEASRINFFASSCETNVRGFFARRD